MTAAVPAARWLTMRPPLLLALALWGWQADQLIVALVMGVAVELPRLVPRRLDIAPVDFNRMWSFTAVLFLGVIFFLFLSRQGFDGVASLTDSAPGTQQEGVNRISDLALTLLRWLPFVLFPFTAAHAWSRTVALPWSTFSLYEQARAKRAPDVPPPEWAVRPMHPGYLYLAVVLFASTTAIRMNLLYVPCLLALLTWGLWPWRNPRYGVVSWGLVLIGLLGVAAVARHAHQLTRLTWDTMEYQLMQVGAQPNTDQMKRTTAMGSIGRLKQSGAIILRIETADGQSPGQAPGLLREAAFNRFRGDTWDLRRASFVAGELGDDRIGVAPARSLTIARYTVSGEIPLAIPDDALAIRTQPLLTVEQGGLSALRVRDAPPLIRYVVSRPASAAAEPVFRVLPEPDDLDLSQLDPREQAVIQATAQQLGLARCAPADAVRVVERWFAREFAYSLWQQPPSSAETPPLVRFLTTSHAGHCEYFATATVLLLRTAGIPTRYAVGFSPQETREATWLARGRDAHAWCQAWIDGRWRDVDTTPGTWAERESAAAPWWEGASDALSQAWYRFSDWRQFGGSWRLVVFLIGVAVLAWIGWRQLRGSRWRRARADAAATPATPIPGLDSELPALCERLALHHGARPPGETLRGWFVRLRAVPVVSDPRWGEALALHERLRFDPAGLSAGDRARLRELAQQLGDALPPR